jgi:hypothetical protein
MEMLKLHTRNRDILLLLGISLSDLLLHLFTNGQYGFHRDELYIMDCSKHLAFGYADMPPLTPFFAKLTINLLGETLQGLRFFPALLSSVIVFLTGLMTKEMGGKTFAQIMASLTIIVSPIYLVAGTQFQTIPVDQFFWVLTCYLFIRYINTRNQRLWLLIGFVVGFGLLAKYSIAFLSLAIFIGILTSKQRKLFTGKWIWFGILIGLFIFLPNIIWQIRNGFPVLEHMQALRKEESTPTIQFLIEQTFIIHPLTLPIWIAGILFFIFSEQVRMYRVLVWIYFIPLLAFLLLKGQSYYMGPAYPVLLAAGSIILEIKILQKQINWVKYAIPILLIVSSVITSPLWLPVLSIEKMKKFGIADISYDFREMIGWPELVSSVSGVYNNLPIEEQKNTIIITGNYGEAGSINHFGPKFGLPAAASGIGSYYYWGPGNPYASTVLVIGYSVDFLKKHFYEVTVEEVFRNKYGINNEEQGTLIILCRKPNKPISEMWPEFKHF